MKDIAALIALASVVLGPALYGLIRRYLDRRTIARLRADVDAQAGRADVAEAQRAATETAAQGHAAGDRAATAVRDVVERANTHPERAAARERVRRRGQP